MDIVAIIESVGFFAWIVGLAYLKIGDKKCQTDKITSTYPRIVMVGEDETMMTDLIIDAETDRGAVPLGGKAY